MRSTLSCENLLHPPGFASPLCSSHCWVMLPDKVHPSWYSVDIIKSESSLLIWDWMSFWPWCPGKPIILRLTTSRKTFKFESLKKALQSENTTITDSRVLFDAVVELSSELQGRLGPQSPILQPLFERAIFMLQKNGIGELSLIEKNAEVWAKKDDLPNYDVDSPISLADGGLKRRRIGISISETESL